MIRKGQEGVPDGYKRCSKCGEVKEVGEFEKKGLRCRRCKALYDAEYRKNNLYSISQTHKKYREKNREHLIAENRLYRKKNIEKIRENDRVRGRRDHERRAQYQKQYRIINFARLREYYINNYKNNSFKWVEWYNKRAEEIIASNCFRNLGIKKADIPAELFEAKVLQIKLIRAIKAQKNNEGHKEVTNG